MDYSLRYYMTWLSKRGEDCRIEILEKNFFGTPTLKKLGSNPILNIDNADNGIIGTSVNILLQADVDGELNDIYTTDSKKFKVVIYRNDIAIWSGYILQELYSEQYIAPPYDVQITATDQLALLKDIDYQPNEEFGRKSILNIIKNALTPTGLQLDFAVQTAMKPTQQQGSDSFIAHARLNDTSFVGMSCYDCLSEILSTASMRLIQIENKWHIYRDNDIKGYIYSYTNDLHLIGASDINPVLIGRMTDDDTYPIDSLVLTKIPAKKNIEIEFSPKVGASVLKNSQMTSDQDWSYNSQYIFEKPGKIELTEGSGLKMDLNAFVLNSTKEETQDIALWQEVYFKQYDGVLNLSFSYLPTYAGAYHINPDDPNANPNQLPSSYEKTTKLVIDIWLEGVSGQRWHLTKNGWSNWDWDDSIIFTGEMVFYSPQALVNKEKYITSQVQMGGIPEDGMLRIGFRNDSRITYDIPPIPIIMPAQAKVAITEVNFSLGEIKGYGSNIKIHSNAAQKGDTYELFYSDAQLIPNEEIIFYNFLDFGENQKQSSWILGNYEYGSFYRAIVQDIANSNGFVKNSFNGIITGKNILALSYIEKFSQSNLRVTSGQYDLVTDELSGTFEEVLELDIEISDYDVTANNNTTVIEGNKGNTTSGGSISGSCSCNINLDNYVTNQALDSVINPILDWFKLDKIGDDWVLKTKYNLASEKAISWRGVSTSGGGGTGGGLIQRVYGYDNITDIFDNSVKTDTFNAYTIAKIAERVSQIEKNGVGGDVDLTGYATEDWVLSKDYATNTAVATLQLAHNTLRSEFDALNNVLNDDVSGKINTWNEVVDFLDEYSGSQDLATILAGINGDISTLQGKFTKDNLQTTLGIADWALAASKPSYAFSEISNKPTSLAGYGITDALSTSGGRIAGNYGALDIYRNTGNHPSLLKFSNLNGTLGYIGFNADKEPVYFTESLSNYIFLHSGNYFDYALPLSGGTIDSTSATALALKAPASLGYTQLRIYSGDTSKGVLQYNTSFGFGIHSSGTLCGIYIADDSKPKFYNANSNAYEFLHEGNYNSYALPLSGGTINGDLTIGEHSASTTTQYYLRMWKEEGGQRHRAMLHVNAEGTHLSYYNTTTGVFTKLVLGASTHQLVTGSTIYDIIHSGNIGEQSVNYATSAGYASKTSLLVNDSSEQKSVAYVSGNIFYIGDTIYPTTSTHILGKDIKLRYGANANVGLTLNESGNVLIGTTTDNGNKLQVYGNISATGSISWGAASDRRLKDNIKTISSEDAIKVIMALNPVTFKWNNLATEKDNSLKGLSCGFVADEYTKVIPNSSRPIWEEYDAIDYKLTEPYVVKGLQSHEERLRVLERENKELKQELNKLKGYGNR